MAAFEHGAMRASFSSQYTTHGDNFDGRRDSTRWPLQLSRDRLSMQILRFRRLTIDDGRCRLTGRRPTSGSVLSRLLKSSF